MRKALLTALLFLWSASFAFALGNATLRFVPYAFNTCPYSVDNGCAGSIAGQAGSTAVRYTTGRQPGGAINQISGSPTNYATNGPSINLPGVDYYVGEYTAQSSLTQVNSGTIPAVCVYNATAGPGSNPTVLCTINGTANLTISGYDFTNGGTTCIALRLAGSTTGTLTVTDNLWVNNGICNDDTIGTPMFSEAATLAGANIIFEYNTLDGNGINFPYDFYGACPAPTVVGSDGCNPNVAYYIVGGATIEYNAILRFIGRTLQYDADNITKGMLFQYNLLQGCCSGNPAGHGEFEEYGGNPGGSQQIYQSNTVLDTTAHYNAGDAAFPAQFVTNNLIPILTVADNFIVEAVSGASTQAGTTITGTASGNTFTTNSISAGTTLGSNSQISCGTSPNNMSFVNEYLGSTGTVSAGIGGGGNSNGNNGSGGTTWPLLWASSNITGTLNNGSGSAGNTLTVTADQTLTLTIGTRVGISGNRNITAMSPTTDPDTGNPYTGTGAAGTYGVSGSAALVSSSTILATPPNIYPGGWSMPAGSTLTCNSQTIDNVAFDVAVAGFGGAMGQITIANNSVDMWAYGPGTTGHVNTIQGALENFNGTILGATLTYNSGTVPTVGYGLVAQTGIPAGTYIVSGTSPIFTLSATLGSVGPVAMTATQAFCTVGPTIWNLGGYNVDMSGIYNTAPGSSGDLMNSYTVNTPGSGSGCGS